MGRQKHTSRSTRATSDLDLFTQRAHTTVLDQQKNARAGADNVGGGTRPRPTHLVIVCDVSPVSALKSRLSHAVKAARI